MRSRHLRFKLIGPAFLLLLLLLPQLSAHCAAQPPQDPVQKHYETAERLHRAGDLAGAENEYRAILVEGYARLGKIYSSAKSHKDALDALEQAAALAPASDEVLLDLSIARFNREQYREALEPLSRALSLNASSAGVHHMLGKSYFMLGEFERSTNELETALKLVPGDYDVAYTLSLSYLKQRKPERAREIYQRMLAGLGDRPQLHIIFGRAFRETGFLPEAIDEFKRAVALDQHFPRAHYYLGLTYLLKDGAARLNDAAEEFKVELAANPQEFFANYYLGVVHLIQRRWDAAIPLLLTASRLQPNNPDPYYHLGEAYQGLQKHREAVEVLRKSIALTPSLAHNDFQVGSAHYRLGQSLLKLGQSQEGERELQLAEELKSKSIKRDKEKTESYINSASMQEQGGGKLAGLVSPAGVVADSGPLDERTARDLKSGADFYTQIVASAHNNIGLLHAERADFRAASEQFKLAARWNPGLEGLDFNRGLAAFKSGSYKEAIPPLERVLGAHPNDLAAKQLLGLSYFMTDDYARASELLTQVVAFKPKDVGLYYTLSLSLLKQGQKEKADRVIQQMVMMSGNSPQLHILLGQAHYERGETEQALAELKTALALDARTPMVHYYSGLIYVKAGKFDEAAREFEGELALNPNDAQAMYHLAFVLLQQQQTERGLRLMREVIQLRPDFADARYELGKALLQGGDVAGALESLEAAARLAPDKPHIQYQLGRAYLAAGRKAEGESHLEISRQLKEKERTRTNP